MITFINGPLGAAVLQDNAPIGHIRDVQHGREMAYIVSLIPDQVVYRPTLGALNAWLLRSDIVGFACTSMGEAKALVRELVFDIDEDYLAKSPTPS